MVVELPLHIVGVLLNLPFGRAFTFTVALPPFKFKSAVCAIHKISDNAVIE